MTILEASNHLWTWYQNNHVFCMEDDFQTMIKITENPEIDRKIFGIALKNFEEGKLVSYFILENKTETEVKTKEYWVLNKPWDTFEQTVTIGPETALAISAIVNDACEEFDNNRDMCNPQKITEKDIQNVMNVVAILSDSRNEKGDGEVGD